MFGKLIRKARGQTGSTLLAALAILSILAVTITGILMFGGWRRTQGLLSLDEVRANSLAESGVHEAIARLAENPRLRNYEQRVAMDSANQISYFIRPWGAYLRIESTGIGRRLSRKLTAVVGMKPPRIYDHVLIPIGSAYPLVVSGSTNIVGDIFIGPAGITRGEINGRGFYGERLLQGDVDTLLLSGLPDYDDSILEEFLDTLARAKESILPSDLSLVYSGVDDLPDREVNPATTFRTLADIEFNSSDSSSISGPQYFFADRVIRVLGKSRLRDIVLCASEVLLSHEADLEDCIIVADHVRLTDASRFSGQLIVKDTIYIETNAILEKPSLVVLIGREYQERFDGLVEISSSGSIEATIISGKPKQNMEDRLSPEFVCKLRITENARLNGLIWWEGLVEIKGTLAGAAAVSLFSHYVQPTTYMNWLVDADVRYVDMITSSSFPIVFSGDVPPRLCNFVGSGSI